MSFKEFSSHLNERFICRGVVSGVFSVKRVRMSYLWETQDSGWPSIGACQTVVPRQSSTNFSWKFGVQWTTILWWKVFAKPGNWTQDLLLSVQLLYHWATRLGWIYKEQLSNMHCCYVSCLSPWRLRVLHLRLASSHTRPSILFKHQERLVTCVIVRM